jgi:hypothetical protein
MMHNACASHKRSGLVGPAANPLNLLTADAWLQRGAECASHSVCERERAAVNTLSAIVCNIDHSCKCALHPGPLNTPASLRACKTLADRMHAAVKRIENTNLLSISAKTIKKILLHWWDVIGCDEFLEHLKQVSLTWRTKKYRLAIPIAYSNNSGAWHLPGHGVHVACEAPPTDIQQSTIMCMTHLNCIVSFSYCRACRCARWLEASAWHWTTPTSRWPTSPHMRHRQQTGTAPTGETGLSLDRVDNTNSHGGAMRITPYQAW